MNSNWMKLTVMTASAMLAVACSPKSADRSSEALNQAVQQNVSAKSLLDWEQSSNHPEKLFAKWNEQMIKGEIKSAEVCAGIKTLKAEDLILFENEIRDARNSALLKDCKGDLIQTLDEYWKSVTPVKAEGAGSSNTDADGFETVSNFKFSNVTQTKNLRNGYKAVSGDLQTKEVILTFDDGPHPEYTAPILATLKQVNAKAIFFHVGLQVKNHPDLVKSVAAHGHAVGAHSMYHRCLPNSSRCAKNNGGHALSMAEASADIRGSMNEIYKVLGWVDPYFRFPYGESSPELKQFLADNETGEFYWSVDSNDWRAKDENGQPWTPDRMIDSVMSQLNRGKKSGIVLMHDVQKKTMIALPELLRRLYADGFTPVLLVPERESERTSPVILKGS